MTRLFLSYRRDDSAGFAGRLADALEAEFGAGSVFRDVDDIRPGEDFVVAIRQHLDGVRAVLVMIGPRWLSAEAGGRRRLDMPDDFVRQEIEAALASGIPVIPVLVGGAVMPAAADLPAALAGLARRQAVVLSDVGWRGDVARLVDSLPVQGAKGEPHAGVNWRRRVLGLGVLGLGLLLLAWAFQVWRSSTPGAGVPTPPVAADPAGRWSARVKYDWGDEHDEVFEFRNLGGQWHGTASYLGGRLALEQVRVEGDWLRFVTRSQEMLGSDTPWKEVTHRYTGQVSGDTIRFTLESTGGYTPHPPLQFTARRAGAAP